MSCIWKLTYLYEHYTCCSYGTNINIASKIAQFLCLFNHAYLVWSTLEVIHIKLQGFKLNLFYIHHIYTLKCMFMIITIKWNIFLLLFLELVTPCKVN